jgi:ABC-type transporter Mla MlaB component
MTVQEDVNGRRLIIEGRLTGLWAGEAERCWKNLLASAERMVTLADVRDVVAIDAGGKALLQEMYRRGVRLVTSGCLMNSVVADITQDCRRSSAWAGRRKP